MNRYAIKMGIIAILLPLWSKMNQHKTSDVIYLILSVIALMAMFIIDEKAKTNDYI